MKNLEKSLQFTSNLVKGKIAETIFSQMLRCTGNFTVLEFGYEKIIPEIASRRNYNEKSAMLDTLRTAPDFAVINLKTRHVKLVEVKYQRKLNREVVLEHALKMSRSWNPSYLFIATLDAFYFDEINMIIKKKGDITLMQNALIDEDIQKSHLKILNDFEKHN